MTAKDAGRSAADLFFAALDKLKGQWVLVTFAFGAIFWAEEQVTTLLRLPTEVAALGERIGQLDTRLGRVEDWSAAAAAPAFTFEGRGRAVADARPGDWSVVRLRRIGGSSLGCGPAMVEAEIADAAGRRLRAETTVTEATRLDADGDVTFGVRVDRKLRPGRATLALRISRDCGGARESAAVPPMGFRVLP